jgi:hypothetical protein
VRQLVTKDLAQLRQLGAAHQVAANADNGAVAGHIAMAADVVAVAGAQKVEGQGKAPLVKPQKQLVAGRQLGNHLAANVGEQVALGVGV